MVVDVASARLFFQSLKKKIPTASTYGSHRITPHVCFTPRGLRTKLKIESTTEKYMVGVLSEPTYQVQGTIRVTIL
jgi:hypothetical protein